MGERKLDVCESPVSFTQFKHSANAVLKGLGQKIWIHYCTLWLSSQAMNGNNSGLSRHYVCDDLINLAMIKCLADNITGN